MENEAPALRPLPGFDWTLVSWGGPEEPQADTCSYCDVPLDDDDSVPLILWNADGWCARFCDNCQRKWWGMETFTDLDDEEEDPAPPDESPSLGPCCICEAETGARTIVMLPVKGVVPGHGWGCVACNLAMDGASAVLCDTCLEDYAAGRETLRFACRGYPATEGRISAEALTEPHAHGPGVQH